MAEAEPVIRAVFPDANVPTSVRSTGVPVVHGSTSDLGSVLDSWPEAHREGIACVIGEPTFTATSRIQSLTPELAKGLEFDLRSVRPSFWSTHTRLELASKERSTGMSR
jgi:hypothetical protein